jgi:Tfp pilus assembly protein PilN
MLRINLATRPFYNERGVHLALAGIGLALLAVTLFNVRAWMGLSAREAELTARTSQEELRARDLRQEAAKIRGSIRQEELEAVLLAAREANGLIDQRTFSWTELFNYLEATLPDGVMLTAVRPLVEEEQVRLTLAVIGRQVDDIDAFMSRLEETQAFREVLSRDEQAQDDGTFAATLVGTYVPAEARAVADGTPPGGGP